MGFYVTGKRGTVRGAARCNPVDACVKLYKGMKGIGTDEEAVMAVVGSHNMKQRQQIRKKYLQVYKKDLIKELDGELSFAFAKLVNALMKDPEEFILECLHRALVPQSMGGKLVKRLSGLFKDGLGKTEYCLMSLIFPRSNKQLEQMKEAFLKRYEVNMDERIASGGNDLPQDFCTLLLEIVSGDRVEEEEGEVDLEEVEEDVDVLVDGEAWEEPFQVIMQERSFPHLRKVLEMYKKETGRVLEELVDESEQLTLELKETYKGLLMLIKSEPEFYADRLKQAIQGAGTDDDTLIRVVVLRSEVDLLDIMNVYKKKYKVTLVEDVEGDTGGDYNKLLMMLLTVPPPEELKKKGEKKVKRIPRVKKEKKKKDEGQGEAVVVEEEDVSGVSEAEVEEKKKTVRRKPKVKGKREEEEQVEAEDEAVVEEEVESEAEQKKPVRRKPKVVSKAKAKKEEVEEDEEEVEEEEEEEVVEIKKKPVKRQPKVVKKVKAKKEEEEVEEEEVVEEEEEEEVEKKKPIRRKPKVMPKVKAKKVEEEEEEEEEAEQEEKVVTVSKSVKGNEAVVRKKRVEPKEEEVEVEETLEEEEVVEVEAENDEVKHVEHSGDEEEVEVEEETPVEAVQSEEAKETEDEMEEASASKVDQDEEDEEDEEEGTKKKVKKSSAKDVGNELTTTSDEGGDTVLLKSREL